MTSATLSAPTSRSTVGRWALGVTAVLFGVATLVEGGNVLFGGPAARAEAGNVVPFVLLFNFGAGFAYVLGGVATVARRAWEWYSRPVVAAAGTGSPRNVYGVSGLYGLVWEWTEDFNSSFITSDNRQDGDKAAALLCGSGSIGSARREDYAAFMRYAFRSSLTARMALPSLGFRCVSEVSP